MLSQAPVNTAAAHLDLRSHPLSGTPADTTKLSWRALPDPMHRFAADACGRIVHLDSFTVVIIEADQNLCAVDRAHFRSPVTLDMGMTVKATPYRTRRLDGSAVDPQRPLAFGLVIGDDAELRALGLLLASTPMHEPAARSVLAALVDAGATVENSICFLKAGLYTVYRCIAVAVATPKMTGLVQVAIDPSTRRLCLDLAHTSGQLERYFDIDAATVAEMVGCRVRPPAPLGIIVPVH